MDDVWTKLKKLFLLMTRFAMTSGVATLFDYVVYLFLVGRFFSPALSNIISYSGAMILNFILQKRFVFSLQRKLGSAFALALLVSLGGMLISTGIVYTLSRIGFFNEHQYITKLIATGIVFFYNFYFKRFVFEKRFFSFD
jgi:putative flippase GtrA